MLAETEESGLIAALPSSPPSKRFLYTVTFFAAIGGFLFGYDTGVISGALLFLRPEFCLSEVQVEAVVSVALIGSTFSFELSLSLKVDLPP